MSLLSFLTANRTLIAADDPQPEDERDLRPDSEILLRGECVRFEGYPKGDIDAISSGWLIIRPAGDDPLRILDSGVLAVPKQGLRIELKRRTQAVTITGASGVEGKPLAISANSEAGNTIDRKLIEHAADPVTVELSSRVEPDRRPYIDQLNASVAHREGEIHQICLGKFDFDKIIEEIVKEVRKEQPAVNKEFEQKPKLSEKLLAQYVAEARQLYEAKKDPKQFVIGLNSSFIDLGIPPLVFTWPPDWSCVFKNLVAMVAVTVALTALAEVIGVATISELAASDAVAALAKFGIGAAEAESIIAGLGAGLVVGMSLKRCG